MNAKQAEQSSVKVAVRVRPFNHREKKRNSECIVKMYENSTFVTHPDTLHLERKKQHVSQFTYDYSFWSHDPSDENFVDQEDMFKSMGTYILDNVYKGYNCSLLAYGQTGCFSPGTEVLLYEGGTKKVEDVQLGDVLVGDDNTPRTVQRLFSGTDLMYDVVLEDGHIYRVNQEHKLVLFPCDHPKVKEKCTSYMDCFGPTATENQSSMSKMTKNFVEIEVRDYVAKSDEWKRHHKWMRTSANWKEDWLDSLIHRLNFEVREVGYGPYYGFSVDGNHRFLGKDFSILRNSGKSFSMMGGTGDRTKGLIPRICEALFKKIESEPNPHITYNVEISYLEIYAEQIRDLIDPKNTPRGGLRVREHPETGPYVENLTEVAVEDYYTVRQFMMYGNKNRATASTKMNDQSSRSHSVFTVNFTTVYDTPGRDEVSMVKKRHATTSKIQLVDLAGSERVKDSGVEGVHLKEATNINQSLTTLGRVISTLAKTSSQKKRSSTSANTFVPFRDSVLTWLLKDSLGGNSKTFMICAISPANINYEETLNTLQYASNAKEIVNQVSINANLNEEVVKALQQEICDLKSKLQFLHGTTEITKEIRENMLEYKERIDQSEALLKRMEETWENKICESRAVRSKTIEECKMHRKSIQKSLQMPFIVNMDPDATVMTELIVHFPPGLTKGENISETFATDVLFEDGIVYLIPRRDDWVHVNDMLVEEKHPLDPGDRITTEEGDIYKFRYPQHTF